MRAKELETVLRERNSIEGVCIRGEWTWLLDGEPVTKAAKTLLREGKAEAIYFRNGRASLSLKEPQFQPRKEAE